MISPFPTNHSDRTRYQSGLDDCFSRSFAHEQQSLCQTSVAPGYAVIPHSNFQCIGLTHQDTETSGTRNRCIEQVPLEQHTVLINQRNNHNRIFAALTFVDGDGIGQDQFIQFVKLVANKERTGLLYKFDFERGALLVDAAYPAHVTIEDAFVVVVARLHDFVAYTQDMIAPLYLHKRRRIEMSLQSLVEGCHTNRPFIHRRKYLDIGQWIKMVTRRQSTLNKIKYQLLGAQGILFSHEKEVAARFDFCRGHMPGIDTVCIDDNFTLLGLAEEFGQAHRGNHLTTQQVTQHVPGSNRR